jgi:cell wall-associated NlpC family hydrolase
MSIADVTSRIAQIQGQLGLLAPSTPVTVPTTVARTSGTASTSGADFAAALASTGYDAKAADAARALGPLKQLSTPPATSGGAAAEQRIVDEAKKYLGVPYLWGGTDPGKGLDCSGLVQLVYRSQGIELPRVSYQQATAGRPVASMAEARPGDILAFNSPVDHVGIYIGNGKMIEAPRTGLNVRVMDVYETPTAIRRVLPPTAPGQTQAAAGAAPVAAAGAGSLPATTPYASLFDAAGSKYGVDPTLLAAVAKQESAFNPRAVSHAGAQGLMQLMPATAAGLGVGNSFDPAQAVDGAARLLRDLTREFGRVDLALAAYNAGPGAVHRYNGIPPYAETQKYVPAVLAHKNALERA